MEDLQIGVYIFVWFQNRRAKWRKQEKLLVKQQQLNAPAPQSQSQITVGVNQQPQIGIIGLPALSPSSSSALLLGMDWSSFASYQLPSSSLSRVDEASDLIDSDLLKLKPADPSLVS